ncbi:MAG: heavy-metal-associated domain-containing protein [Thiobacillus sp.]|nr:heavy-metal-associated domain-containing protein [Thiobacillus sp.]
MTDAFDLDVASLLGMRRHLSIVHHLPGRIRLRIGPALWGIAKKVEDSLFRQALNHLEGISDVRVNMAVASVVIEYDAKQIHPDSWETLVRGDTEAAGDLLNQWLARNGQLLRYTLDEKE